MARKQGQARHRRRSRASNRPGGPRSNLYDRANYAHQAISMH